MGAASVVIVLVGLVIPISLLICALLFDMAVLIWAAHRAWHDRVVPNIVRVVAVRTVQIRRYRLLHR